MAEHWAVQVIKQLEAEGFYGTLGLRLRDGVVVLIEKTETIQPPTKPALMDLSERIARS